MSGDCVRAVHYGVNPRFLLAVARATMAKAKSAHPASAQAGVEAFRLVSRDVTLSVETQLDDALLERLGQIATDVRALARARLRAAGLRVLHRLQRA